MAKIMDDEFRPLYFIPPEELRPTTREWFKHGFLFLLTLITATMAGLLPPLGSGVELPKIEDPTNLLEWLLIIPNVFAVMFTAVITQVWANPAILFNGLAFSLSLLTILTFHEFGHYIACRLYGVKATLPYFIPLPFLSPAGTLGAVIKMQSPMPTRKAIFDIGVAGPLAGFAVIIPIAIVGLATMQYAPPGAPSGLTFADPLLTRLIGSLMGVDPTLGLVNPFYSAAWVGTLVTSLNLLPVSQLDGGHAVYSVLGERIHYWIGRVAFVVMVILTIIGWEIYNTPGTLIFTILLAVLLRLPHPEPLIDEPIDAKRRLIAVLTLAVFVLSFMPFPIQIN
ncbi:MAG: site-2 protease family protein [Pyrinomonadaceae bacterium]